MNNPPDLSKKIVALRKKLGWNQTQLAEHVGVTQSTVSRWEQGGAPKMWELFDLAKLDPETPISEWVGVEWPNPRRPFAIDEAPVVGTLQANDWRPEFEWPAEKQYPFDFPELREIVGPKKKAFIVEDQHFSRRFPPGSILVVVQYPPGVTLTEGDIVVCHRFRRVDEMWESTCRQVRLIDGKPYFYLNSDRPDMQGATLHDPDGSFERTAVAGFVCYATSPIPETLRHATKDMRSYPPTAEDAWWKKPKAG